MTSLIPCFPLAHPKARRSNQSILKEINPGIPLEGMMLKLKLQYFSHLMGRADSLEKTLMLGGIGGRKKGTTEDEMAGWHHGLDGRESEWTPGDGDGQVGLVCCDSWGCKESDTTERLNWLNWTEYYQIFFHYDWNIFSAWTFLLLQILLNIWGFETLKLLLIDAYVISVCFSKITSKVQNLLICFLATCV